MSRRSTPLTDELYDYLVEVSVRETDVLRRLRQETAELKNAHMQISPEQGQFMTLLIGLMGARNALELGTFTGYSALCVAMALPEGGRLVTIDVDSEAPSFAMRYWAEAGVTDRIDLRIGDAMDVLNGLIASGASDAFDFAFIDADKAHLDEYYEKCLTLVRGGGVIAVDNTLWKGKVVDQTIRDNATNAIRGFNVKVHEDKRVDLSLLPIGDGLTLIRKRGEGELGGGLRPEFR